MTNNEINLHKKKSGQLPFLFHPEAFCFLLIFLGFTLTSSAWISWFYHLLNMTGPANADLFTLVVGYLSQAAGIGLFILVTRKVPDSARALFTIAVPVFMVFCVPASLSHFLFASLLCGWLMNIAIGVIAGFYLYDLSKNVSPGFRGAVFGGSYGLSAIATWLFSMISKGNFLKSGYALIAYTVTSAAFLLFVYARDYLQTRPGAKTARTDTRADEVRNGTVSERSYPARDTNPSASRAAMSFFTAESINTTLLLIAGTTVFLFSLEKNIGFSFPSADLVTNVNLELSRVVYSAGLIMAGLISDKSRKSGTILALTALVTPFIMLALAGEPISSTIFWGLDYFFFGFFSVFRVLLFTDLASIPSKKSAALPAGRAFSAAANVSDAPSAFPTGGAFSAAANASDAPPAFPAGGAHSVPANSHDASAAFPAGGAHSVPANSHDACSSDTGLPLLCLAGAGLMAGRLGDAVGTLFSIGLRGRVTMTVIVTLLFFIYSVLMFFRLYQRLYMPIRIEKTSVNVKSDAEIFEDFSARHGLTVREKSVLRLILQEYSNAEIAQQLFVSESTVKFHIHNILAKTGSGNRIALTAKYRNTDAAVHRG